MEKSHRTGHFDYFFPLFYYSILLSIVNKHKSRKTAAMGKHNRFSLKEKRLYGMIVKISN